MQAHDEQAQALIARVLRARADLAAAASGADMSGIAEALEELERAHRLARESGVVVPRPAAQTEETRS